jgi:hypothetical protein
MADFRDLVRQRAGNRCEYCRKLEMFGNYPHHLEHIIARKHGGLSEMGNLAWACFQCNVAKGTDIASCDTETKELAPLFNPRTQDWNDHFELVGDDCGQDYGWPSDSTSPANESSKAGRCETSLDLGRSLVDQQTSGPFAST